MTAPVTLIVRSSADELGLRQLLATEKGCEQLALYLARLRLKGPTDAENYIAETLAALAPHLTEEARWRELEGLADALRGLAHADDDTPWLDAMTAALSVLLRREAGTA